MPIMKQSDGIFRELKFRLLSITGKPTLHLRRNTFHQGVYGMILDLQQKSGGYNSKKKLYEFFRIDGIRIDQIIQHRIYR